MSPEWPKRVRLRGEMLGCVIAAALCISACLIGRLVSSPPAALLLAIAVVGLQGYRIAAYFATFVAAICYYQFFLDAGSSLSLRDDYATLAFLVVAGVIIAALRQSYPHQQRLPRISGPTLEPVLQDWRAPVLLIDQSLRISDCNKLALTTLGYETTSLLGKSITAVMPQFSGEFTLQSALHTVLGNGDHGSFATISCTIGDYTAVFLRDGVESSTVAEELKKAQESLSTQLESIPALLYIHSPNGRLERINHRVSDFSNISLERMRADDGLSIVHPDEQSRVISLCRKKFKGSVPFYYEFRHLRADGAYRWFSANAEPQKNEHREVVRWYTLLTDIEERKAFEMSVRADQANLGEASRISTVAELTASVAHEISQPLSAIISNSQASLRYLSTKPLNEELLTGAVQRILRDARDASQTVKNTRALFSRRRPEAQPVDIQKLIAEVLLLHEARIDELGIVVKLAIDHRLPPVPADRLQIQQILANLIRNAIESMELSPEHPKELELKAHQEDNLVLIAVLDSGPGFTNPEKLFDPFFTTKNLGMGMGLRISKTMVEAHEGRLWADALPRGAKFSFTLPLERGMA